MLNDSSPKSPSKPVSGEVSFFSVSKIASLWGLSERSVRKYLEDGRIPGAKKQDGDWLIPASSKKPSRLNKKRFTPTLLAVLRKEDSLRLSGGIYHKVQIELTYNSNHLEGSRLTHDQTRYIFETNTILPEGRLKGVRVDDVVETANHFRCVDYIIEHANRRLTESMLKKLHFLLKTGTSDSLEDWFAVGDYKHLPNEVGGQATTPPEQVKKEIRKLLAWYNRRKVLDLDDLLNFHHSFELIHPFQDGNGRVGRLILFKECLRLGVVPFIIDDDLKMFYYRGLKEWKNQPGYLRETCLAAQDKFKTYLDYYKIPY